MRGARTAQATAPHLLAALTHGGVVLAQRQIADKSNEITAFISLLQQLDLTGFVITGDAMHRQRANAHFLREDKDAHFILPVLDNQPRCSPAGHPGLGSGHAPEDLTAHRARARWYTTKTEPSYDDMAVKLRRVIIAARFRSPRPVLSRPPRKKPGPFSQPGPPPGHDQQKLRNTRGSSRSPVCTPHVSEVVRDVLVHGDP